MTIARIGARAQERDNLNKPISVKRLRTFTGRVGAEMSAFRATVFYLGGPGLPGSRQLRASATFVLPWPRTLHDLCGHVDNMQGIWGDRTRHVDPSQTSPACCDRLPGTMRRAFLAASDS